MKATLSSVGAELIDNGYRIVPIEPGTKSPNLRGWSEIRATKETLEQWKAEGRGNWGVGILGEQTPGVDLDISDSDVLDKVLAWSRENIGVDNRRVGRAPRVLFTCRSDAPFSKMSSRKFQSPDGGTHQIEILGKGTQYVAYAVHPDTKKPYAWEGLDPVVMPAELLPTLTPEKARELIKYFESVVPPTWTPISKASASSATSEHESNPRKTAALHRVRSAVEAIPNKDLPYEDWIRVMYALWVAVGEHKYEGLEIFDEWSSKSEKYDLEETHRVWSATHDVKHIGAGTLFHLAKQNGWVEPPEDLTAWMEVVDDIPLSLPTGAADAGPAAEIKNPIKILKTLSFEDMQKMQEPEWLVAGVLIRNTSALMFGKSNAYKSFTAIDLALSVGTGREWHGCAVQKTKVLLVATEGANGVGRLRVPGWYAHYEIPSDLRENVRLYPQEISLDVKDNVDILIATMRYHGIGLLLLDIFGGTMNGTEVEDTTAREWSRNIQRILRETGATVLTVAHTGWADETRARMHTHFWGSFDTRLKVEGDKEKLISTTTIERHKDADSTGKWGFRMEKSHGTLIPVLDDKVNDTYLKLTTAQKRALAALEEALEVHGTNVVEEHLPLTAKIVPLAAWRDACERKSISNSDKPSSFRTAFSRVKKELIELGIVGEHNGYVWNQEDEK